MCVRGCCSSLSLSFWKEGAGRVVLSGCNAGSNFSAVASLGLDLLWRCTVCVRETRILWNSYERLMAVCHFHHGVSFTQFVFFVESLAKAFVMSQRAGWQACCGNKQTNKN